MDTGLQSLQFSLNIIMWVLGLGFTFFFSILVIMWMSINKRFDYIDKKFDAVDKKFDLVNIRIDKLDEKINTVEQRLNNSIDKLGAKVEDVNHRLCRIEGSLASQGHCLFNQTHKEKQAE